MGRDLGRGRAGAVAAACALAIATAAFADGRAAAQGGTLDLRQVARFEMPVHVEDAPGKPKLLFVVEQTGTVQVLRNGRTLAKPFLDLRDRVQQTYEEGLLSIAFDPRYPENRRVFLYYTGNDGDIHVDSFKHKRSSATRASARSRRKLIEIEHPGESNHNGGQLQFGPDGFLYLGTGDGGGAGDPDGSAQDPESLLGKLLRLDPKRKRGYRSPDSNPFVGTAGRDEVYALGLRNPWRFSFEANPDRLWIGDAGQATAEEIDRIEVAAAAGANFGWNLLEGNEGFEGDPGNPPPNYVPPVHTYSGGCAVIGGYVVADPRLPALAGRYLYADNCGGQIRSLDAGSDSPSETDAPTGLEVASPTSFGEGAKNRLYVASLDGPVYRIVQE